jgi:regulator of sirC expression with transglutaminase-like and TPR domain
MRWPSVATTRASSACDEYIRLHPDDGPAHLERGGAYYNMQRRKEAQTDAARACELGVSEGCVRAKQLAKN